MARSEEEYSLFEREETVLQRAEEMVTLLDDVAHGVRRLADAYRRGYREQSRLVRISDRMQGNLQDVNRKLAEQSEVLERLATTDSLTGLTSRHRFLERAGEEFSRWERGGAPGALLVLDLDHFKRVNDTWGHAAGDAVLQAVADAFRRTLRIADVAGRLGGEEFAVLAPDTGPDDALALAERLRTRAQDPEEVVQKRMSKAADEMSHWPEYDYVVVNREVEESVGHVQAILRAERLRRERQVGLPDFVNRLRDVE